MGLLLFSRLCSGGSRRNSLRLSLANGVLFDHRLRALVKGRDRLPSTLSNLFVWLSSANGCVEIRDPESHRVSVSMCYHTT